jgi:hypothetical protein
MKRSNSDLQIAGADNMNIIRAILGNKRREVDLANDVNRLIERKERELFPGGSPIKRRKRKD